MRYGIPEGPVPAAEGPRAADGPSDKLVFA